MPADVSNQPEAGSQWALAMKANATTIRAASGFPVGLADQQRHERTLHSARQLVAAAAWAKAWAKGLALSGQQIVALALAAIPAS